MAKRRKSIRVGGWIYRNIIFNTNIKELYVSDMSWFS